MFLPIKVRSDYSIGQSIFKVKDIAKHCKQLGYSHCCLTDIGSVGGMYQFFKACEKEGIVPIAGCEFSFNSGAKLILLAKNKKGWSELTELVSISNSPDNFNKVPILNINQLKGRCENLIGILPPQENLEKKASVIKSILGSVYLVFEWFGQDGPETRKLAKQIGTKALAGVDARYKCSEDAEDHRALLCSALSTTLPKMKEKIRSNEIVEGSEFFQHENYFIPSEEELLGRYSLEETNYDEIIGQIEQYSLNSDPILPKFDCEDEFELLRQQCIEGWKKRKTNTWDTELYGQRVKDELAIIKEFKLPGYFLIIKDLMDYSRRQGWLTCARGSVGGSLVAYLQEISIVDPIKFDLIFSRFFNPGRAAEGSFSLPDIDVDVQIEGRDKLIDYLRATYGEECVGQIITHNKLKGAGALKEVLRVHEACSFMEANKMTAAVPQEAKIGAQMKEDGETSIIKWCLKHMPSIFDGYCKLEGEEYVGEYALFFEQAVRLEGVIKSTGKHAAGVIISDVPLKYRCPMVHDASGNGLIGGMDFVDLEAMGICKLDVLSVAALSKLNAVNQLLRYGIIMNPKEN